MFLTRFYVHQWKSMDLLMAGPSQFDCVLQNLSFMKTEWHHFNYSVLGWYLGELCYSGLMNFSSAAY